MKSLRNLSVSVIVLSFALTASAQTARTFVSAQLGNDANLCGATSPCRSFARAITQTVPGGEVVVLDSGGYGKFSVPQSITIQAPTGVYAGCTTTGAPADNGATIAAGASDTVILRGLMFNGLGTSNSGIVFQSGSVLHIENCIVNGFAGNGIDSNLSGGVFINDTIVRNGGSGGIVIGTGRASVNRCRIEKNAGAAIVANNGANVIASESVAAGNGLAGFDAETNGTLNLENCIASGNGTGVAVGAAGATTRVSNSVVTNNTNGLSAGGGGLLTRQNNMVEGNNTDGTFTGTIAAK